MSRPLNFLHLTTFYPPYSFGGDAMYIYRLAHALGDAGHNIDVVHCTDSYHMLHPDEPEIKFADHPNVKTHRLASGYKWLSPLLTQQTGRLLLKQKPIRQVLDSKPYDVIHFHNTSLLGPEVLTLNPRQGRPVKIYTTHEHWLICPMHVLWKFNSRPCEKPECLRCTVMGKRPPQFWRYTNMLASASRHVDQFVSPSRFTAKMHADRGFTRPVDHLPYFIDPADYDWMSPRPRPHSNPYFLFVGRLEAIKGLQTLIKFWPRVRGADLLVAGTGNNEAELRSQAATNPAIKFLGAVSQHELGPLYYHAVATIIPSLTYETFGMIIIESFARKTPVIVRNLGALPEIVNDGGGGFVYSNDDELLEAVGELTGSPALRSELGEKGYQAFVRSWSTEAHLELYFDYLRRAAIKKFGHTPWEEDMQTPSAIQGSIEQRACHG